MHETLIRASDALRQGMPALRPALMGCTACGTVDQIAGPALSTCVRCGTVNVVLDHDALFAEAADRT